jgi:hypothetical protein
VHVVANLGQISVPSFIIFVILFFPKRDSLGTFQKIKVLRRGSAK